jgi:hypothetical protein
MCKNYTRHPPSLYPRVVPTTTKIFLHFTSCLKIVYNITQIIPDYEPKSRKFYYSIIYFLKILKVANFMP